MPYLGSLVVALAALLVLAVLLLAARGPARRFTVLRVAVTGDLGERATVLSARVAALRARRAQRTRAAGEAPTIEMARSDRGSSRGK